MSVRQSTPAATDGHHHHGHEHGRAAPISGAAKDPVCGMDVDPHAAKHTASHAGRTYYFCSAGCRAKFVATPARYLSPEQAQAEPVLEGAIYTCPMHPEIRQVGPGSCPICGMALEPVEVGAEADPNPELVDMKRRFWIGLVLAVPVVVLEMGGHLIDLHTLIGAQVSNWVQLVLATPVVLWAGWPFFVRGWASLKTGNLNMFTLIAMGTGVAWVYSIVGDAFARPLPGRAARTRRRGAGLFRGGCRHHGAGAARAGARAQGARADERRHPGTA